jgi:hypothetical protein
MAASFLGEEKLVEAQVSDQRVSIPATAILDPHNSPSAPEKHHKHSLLGITSLHGMLLAFSFFTLSVGVIGIRSGLPKSFKLHWVIQAFGGTGIIVGCLMGIWISFKVGPTISSSVQCNDTLLTENSTEENSAPFIKSSVSSSYQRSSYNRHSATSTTSTSSATINVLAFLTTIS